jgi:glycosyltransferase involved in cell wall biosynthesis
MTVPLSIHILSRHSPQAASSRLRTIQFIPYLEAAGAEVQVFPFFDQSYLQALYRTGGRRIQDITRAYLRRLLALRATRGASVVWVEKELFPFLPGTAESLLTCLGVPYVVDYDDATFHVYDQHRSGTVRKMLGNKLEPLLRGAYAVTAGNSYLEEYALEHGARKVVRIPTVVDISRYDYLSESRGDELRIGWIGTPATAKYLEILRIPLQQVAQTRKVRLVTIGAPPLHDFGVPMEQHDWSADTEAGLLSSIHVGVMPLPDESFERGKCGYKLIQYMACGRPVIASPVGVNSDIVTPQIGLLAKTPADWIAAFQYFGANTDIRRRTGVAGRTLVEQKYSISAVAPAICELLMLAAGQR